MYEGLSLPISLSTILPLTFSEFHQLADEAEDELREMESMLALLPPPAPPNDKKTIVDTSIESAAKEMTEIEGNLVTDACNPHL